MTDTTRDELLQLTQTLLDSIAQRRLADVRTTVRSVADRVRTGGVRDTWWKDSPSTSSTSICRGPQDGSVQTTIMAPHVRHHRAGRGDRLLHAAGAAGDRGRRPVASSQETRVWH